MFRLPNVHVSPAKRTRFGRKTTRKKVCAERLLANGNINTWAVSLLRYGAGVMTWRRHELQGMDRKTRKLLTMYGAFHPKSDVDRRDVDICPGQWEAEG